MLMSTLLKRIQWIPSPIRHVSFPLSSPYFYHKGQRILPRISHLNISSLFHTDNSLDINKYHKIADEAIDHLLSHLESLVEENQSEQQSWDVEYAAGVLTLSLGSEGTYVINKQPPNKQIWLSSPVSGPKRYDYDEEKKIWFYHRDNSTLESLLSKELSIKFKKPLSITLK